MKYIPVCFFRTTCPENLFASDESRTSLHVSITFARTYAYVDDDSIRGIFSRRREVYTTSKSSASRNDSLQFMHSAMCLLDRHVRVGAHAGVGVRDSDASEALSADHVRHFFRRRVAVDQEVIFRCVAVRPAIQIG